MSHKSKLEKHLGFLTDLGEFRFKRWLDANAYKFLMDVGVGVGQKVLDVGCGSGTYTIPAAKIVGESGIVYALDTSRQVLDRMEERAAREELRNVVRVDGGEIDDRFEGSSIDHVLLIDVLQEIRDRGAMFDGIYRVLKPGGSVIVYPMHMAAEDVIEIALKKPFSRVEKKFGGRILVFRKTRVDEPDT
ncbi:class I SAM-dependent methyltransferase [Candidatus Bathyarchaeota archaeon]|nr:class I SAM-dependent methyltransferase [Candidatus Bathyarchaeota archaeon]